jgi:hypothetical protein
VCVECGRTYDANYEGKEYGRYYEEETGTWGTDRQKMIDFIFDTSKDDDEFVRRADNVVYLRMKVIDAQIGR